MVLVRMGLNATRVVVVWQNFWTAGVWELALESLHAQPVKPDALS